MNRNLNSFPSDWISILCNYRNVSQWFPLCSSQSICHYCSMQKLNVVQSVFHSYNLFNTSIIWPLRGEDWYKLTAKCLASMSLFFINIMIHILCKNYLLVSFWLFDVTTGWLQNTVKWFSVCDGKSWGYSEKYNPWKCFYFLKTHYHIQQ